MNMHRRGRYERVEVQWVEGREGDISSRVQEGILLTHVQIS